MRIVTFKLDEITLRKLDELASKLGLSRSEIIRLALLNYMSKENISPKKQGVKIRHVVLT
ncbi:MAG: CopG family transcriptional regulator [Desulfurococcaceae archaeon TW002]